MGDSEQWEKEQCGKEEADVLSPPGVDIQIACIAQFIDQTLNAAVAQSTCGVCGSLSRKFKLEGLCLQDLQIHNCFSQSKTRKPIF